MTAHAPHGYSLRQTPKRLERERLEYAQRIAETRRVDIQKAEERLHRMLRKIIHRYYDPNNTKPKDVRKTNYAFSRNWVFSNFSSEVRWAQQRFLVA